MLRFIAFLALITVGFVAAFFSRFAALLVYLWFAMFRPQEWVWWDITGWRLSLVLGLMVVAPSLLTGIYPNITHPLSIGAMTFLACGLISQAVAAAPAAGWTWLSLFSRLVLMCLFAVTILHTRRQFVIATSVLAGSLAFFTAKAGLNTLLVGGVRYAAGQAGAFVDNNGYAMATVMILPLLIATAQNLRGPRLTERMARLGFIAAVPLSILTVISTFSRAGILALLLATLAFIGLQRRRVGAMIALVIIVVALLPFVPLPTGYLTRVQTIQDPDQDRSASGRLHFWNVALVMVADRPLGVGFGGFEAEYDRYDWLYGLYGNHRAVHSSHMQVLTETGVLGFAVWVVMFVLAFRIVARVRRRSGSPDLSPEDQRFMFTMANGFGASMVGFLVGGGFVSLALNDLTWFTFAFIAALDRISAQAVALSGTKAHGAPVATSR